jgi:dTDP-4-amino-4,6-dideoxygalactose transaminase
MKKMKYQSSFPFFDDNSIHSILTDIEAVLRSGTLTDGPRTQELERKFCEYTKGKHAVAVSSGAASLEVALRYFGIKDREVIVPTNTFVATPNSVVFAGGRPVFADMKEDTLCIDPHDVERRISSKTVGIIVVHIAGLVCPQINELSKLCKDHGIFLIEDCAHAHGAMIDDKMAGTLGDAGCFSFAPTKVMTTGEGGILITDDAGLTEAAFSMRNRGLDSKRLMVMLGHSWCMSEISAVLGLHQLENLDYFVSRRNEIAKRYDKYLRRIASVSVFKTPSNVKHSYHKYPVQLAEDLDAEKIASILKDQYGVETGRVYYPPCHLHPYYKTTFRTREGDFPVAENVLKQVLCLPIHLGLDDEQIEYISNSVQASIEALVKDP